MDPTLLQLQTRTTEPSRTDESNGASSEVESRVEIPEVETAAQFRELIPASPQLPLRMKFEPPIDYDGKKYDQIIVDFESMIGNDFMRCEREFQMLYKPAKNELPMPEMKPLYHMILIAHAGDVPLGLVRKLPARYYSTLRQEALKACGSSSEEEKV